MSVSTWPFSGARLEDAVDPAAHAREGGEVAVDEVARLEDGQPRLAREALRSHAVEQAEVHGLGLAPHRAVDVFRGHAEDDRGRGGVDVAALPEGLGELLVPERCARMRSSTWL